jgi:hypothetical protein
MCIVQILKNNFGRKIAENHDIIICLTFCACKHLLEKSSALSDFVIFAGSSIWIRIFDRIRIGPRYF